jgi:arylsulfatase
LISTLLLLTLQISTAHGKEQGSENADQSKPNILVIFSDDVGVSNVSAYHRGMMGGRTPNIDRIAEEGALFTDYYAQQSCTAGRSAFITGQHPFRTGLLRVGVPGSNQGLQDEHPTIAGLLQPHGYATAQIGKNHLGDRNEFLPTVHGFDEFFGNLYHMNAEEEPEDPEYPKDPKFYEMFGHASARWACKCARTPDPEFNAEERAFYYVRVLEIPTPRWTTYDAAFYGIDLPEGVSADQQERAYTSPIWYTPET